MAQLADTHALLIYRVGPVLCCAPTHPVETLIQPPPLTHPPGSSDSRPGIFRHDGKLVSLIEVRQLFGVAEQDRKQPGRIIICRIEDRHTGFLIDEVIDVIDTPASGWGQLSPSLSGGVFNRSLLLNNKIHLYAEFEKLQKVRNDGFLKAWIEQLQEKPPPQKTSIASAENVDITSVQAKESTTASAPLSSTPLPADLQPDKQQRKVSPTNMSPPTGSSTLKHSQSDCARQDRSQQEHTRLERNNPNHQPGTHQRSPARKNSMLKTRSINENRQQNKPGNIKPQTTPSATASRPAAPLSTPQPSPAQPSSFTQTKPNSSSIPQISAPAADARSSTPAHRHENKKEAGTGLLPVTVLLISTGLIATLVYLWPDHSANLTRIPAGKAPAITSEAKDPMASEFFDLNQSTPPPIPDKTPNRKPDEIPDESQAPATHDTRNNENRYHAAIKHQRKEHGANEITIIITAPASDEVIRPEAGSHGAYKQSVEISSSPVTPDLPADKHEQQQQKLVVPQRIDEVVHIVVKGDTLWHIARRYIHNPFRYPELARLNKIRNPDLIYPGDRVRIIRIYQQATPASAN